MNMQERLPLNHELAKREWSIIGHPQRIEPLSEDAFDETGRGLVAKLRSTLNKDAPLVIPEMFGVMLKCSDIFKCQMELTMQLLGKGALLPRERELAILRVGWLCRAPYEWGEHVWVAKKFGVTDEEIERVTQGALAKGWSEHDAAILAGVEEMLDDQMISDYTWNTLAKSWSEKQLMEFIIVVGQYYGTALLQNSLRVRLGDTNGGLRDR